MCHGKTVGEVRIKGENITNKLLDWFCVNKMKVNNDNFQYILSIRNGILNSEHLRVGSSEVIA